MLWALANWNSIGLALVSTHQITVFVMISKPNIKVLVLKSGSFSKFLIARLVVVPWCCSCRCSQDLTCCSSVCRSPRWRWRSAQTERLVSPSSPACQLEAPWRTVRRPAACPAAAACLAPLSSPASSSSSSFIHSFVIKLLNGTSLLHFSMVARWRKG